MNNRSSDKSTGNKILGQNIKNIRKILNLTQEEFAEKLNINCQFLSQVETGKVGISLENAIKICKVANCSSNVLFRGIIEATDINDKYELLDNRDKSIINQIIDYLLNSK